jgi:hypothetical protein
MTIVDIAQPGIFAPVDTPKGFAVTPGKDDLDHGSESPGVTAVAGAAFRLGNTVGAALSREYGTAIDSVEDGFNAWDRIKGTRYERHWESFVRVRNSRALSAMQRQIDREEEDQRILRAAPGYISFPAQLAAGVLDPLSLVPGGTFIRGVKGGISVARSALSVGAAAGVSTTAQEFALHRLQETRELSESATNIGASVFLGSLIGAGGAKLVKHAEWKRAVTALDRDVYGYPAVATGERRYTITDSGRRFVTLEDGSDVFGDITPAIAREAGLESGPIRLAEKALPGARDEGELHIEAGHGASLRKNGHKDAAEFVKSVTSDFNEIYWNKLDQLAERNSILLVKRNGDAPLAIVSMKPSDQGGWHWEVITAFVSNDRYLKDRPLLWSRSRQGDAAPGPAGDAAGAAGRTADDAAGNAAARGGAVGSPDNGVSSAHGSRAGEAEAARAEAPRQEAGTGPGADNAPGRDGQAAGRADGANRDDGAAGAAGGGRRAGEAPSPDSTIDKAGGAGASRDRQAATNPGEADAGSGTGIRDIGPRDAPMRVRGHLGDGADQGRRVAAGLRAVSDGGASNPRGPDAGAGHPSWTAGHEENVGGRASRPPHDHPVADRSVGVYDALEDRAGQLGTAAGAGTVQEKAAGEIAGARGEAKADVKPDAGLPSKPGEPPGGTTATAASEEAALRAASSILEPGPDARGVDAETSIGVAAPGGRETASASKFDQSQDPGRADKLAARFVGLAHVMKYMTPDEIVKLRKNTAQKFIDLFGHVDSDEVAAVAYAGRVKRDWHTKSAKAIVDIFGAEDAPRFAALLAAMSPRTTVEANTINALRVWTNWIKTQRPQDEASIIRIMGESVQGNRGVESVLRAWIPNVVSALTHPDPAGLKLSGPKVNSFFANLRDIVTEVTLDVWMAIYFNLPQTLFKKSGKSPGKGPGYVAIAATIREAAEVLSQKTGETWTPVQVQASVWSWTKTLYEKASRAGENRTALEILKAGDLTHEDIAGTPDFALLFMQGVYRKILELGGYGEEIRTVARISESRGGLAGRDGGRSDARKAEGSGFAQGTFELLLERAAARIDQARASRREAEAGGNVEPSHGTFSNPAATKAADQAALSHPGRAPSRARKRQDRYADIGGDRYVRLEDGRDSVGDIPPDVARSLGREAAPIRLPEGRHDVATGLGYGEAHIMARHGDELRAAGYDDVADLVAEVAGGYSAVYRAKDNRIFLVKANGHAKAAAVELAPGADGQTHWSVTTAGLYRPEDFKEADRLWRRPGPAVFPSHDRPSFDPGSQSTGNIGEARVSDNPPATSGGSDSKLRSAAAAGLAATGLAAASMTEPGGEAGDDTIAPRIIESLRRLSRKRFDDVGFDASAKTLMKDWNGGLTRAFKGTRAAFTEHWKAAGPLDAHEFNAAVGRALRNDGEADDPQAARAARLWRAEVFEPIALAAVKAGLLPDGVEVSNAASYFSRTWSRSKLFAMEREFKDTVAHHAAERMAREPGGSADVRAKAREIADDLFDTLTGRSDTGSRPGQDDPGRDSGLHIPDTLAAPFLEDDIELVGRRFVRTMGADLELAQKFGTPDMAGALQEIRDSYAQRRARAADETERLALTRAERRDIADLEFERDRIRGTRIENTIERDYARIVRAASRLDAVRAAGQVGLPSLHDAIRPAMVEGLSAYMQAVDRLAAELKAVPIASGEAALAGRVAERVLAHRLSALADIDDPYAARTPADAFLQKMTDEASSWNGVRIFADMQKSFAAVMVQDRILRGARERADRSGIGEPVAAQIAAQFEKYGQEIEGVRVPNTTAWDKDDATAAALRAFRAAVNKDTGGFIAKDTPAGEAMLALKNFALASWQRLLLRGLDAKAERFMGGLIAMTAMGMFAAWTASPDVALDPERWIGEGFDRAGIMTVPLELSDAFEKATGFDPLGPIKGPESGARLLPFNAYPGIRAMLGYALRN